MSTKKITTRITPAYLVDDVIDKQLTMSHSLTVSNAVELKSLVIKTNTTDQSIKPAGITTLGHATILTDKVVKIRTKSGGEAQTVPASGFFVRLGVDTDFQDILVTNDSGTKATCSIVAVAVANLVNDEGFTLVDADNTSVVFKFSIDSGGVTGADVTVSVSTGQTASQVASAIQAAVDGHASFSATVSTDTVTVTQAKTGDTTGNTSNSETVTDTGFSVADFSGGADGDDATLTGFIGEV